MSKEEQVSTALVQEIAAAEGVDPTELPPLYDAIDTDALDALVQQSGAADVTVEFDYGNYRIHIGGTREITITPSDRPTGEAPAEPCCD